MAVFLHILKIMLIILVVFFVLTFTIYFFNLDMKLTSALQGPIQKLQEKQRRDRHL
jgi:phosphotransferase system  glucose/maltose/N-acetylglucosamine-specific IIC component